MKKTSPVKSKDKTRIGMSVSATHLSFVRTVQGKVQDHENFVLEDIPQSLTMVKKRIKKDYPCHLALPQKFIMLKRLVFAEYFKEKEIETLLMMNAQQYFSSPLESLFYDFEYLGKNQKHLRLIAGKKEEIHFWIDAFKKTSLDLKLITINVLAIEQFFRHHHLLNTEITYAIFLLSGNELIQIVMVNGFIELINIIAIDGFLFDHCQEIKKFLRRYENNNQTSKVINEIIILGKIDLSEDNKKALSLKISVHETLQSLIRDHLPVDLLLPWGVALGC